MMTTMTTTTLGGDVFVVFSRGRLNYRGGGGDTPAAATRRHYRRCKTTVSSKKTSSSSSSSSSSKRRTIFLSTLIRANSSSSSFDSDASSGGARNVDGDENASSSLQKMIDATNALDERFRSGLPFVDATDGADVALAEDCEYENDVYAVRGKKEVASLMKHWSANDDETTSNFEFQFETLRSASVEPGTLLLQWKATWKPNAQKKRKYTNALLVKAKPSESLVSLKKKMDSAVFLATEEELAKEKEDDPFGSVYIYGVTTYKVNAKGEITRREDKVDWRFADKSLDDVSNRLTKNNRSSSSSTSSNKMSPERAESLQKLGYNAVSSSASKLGDGASRNKNNSWAAEEADLYDDLEAKRMSEDIAATMLYNALSPPGIGEWSWFLQTTVELEYQSFTKAMGDESTGMLSKDEFVKYVLAVVTFGFIVPLVLVCVATWQMLTGDGMMDEDGGLSQAALDQMDPYDRAEYLSMREKELNQQKKLQGDSAVAGGGSAAVTSTSPATSSPSLTAPSPQIEGQQQRSTTPSNDDIPVWGTQVWLDIIQGRIGA